MTISLVAVVTDVVRDERRVVGYGFNSNGRWRSSPSMRTDDLYDEMRRLAT